MAVMARPFPAPNVGASTGANTPMRRCTFRRVTAAARPRELPVYDVACMFPDRIRAVPLGDLESARSICESCTYNGIFRPDAD